MSDLPETMRAVMLTGHGGREMLRYREDIPVPAPAPGEVLVRVGACVTAERMLARAQADFVAKDFIGKLVITTERVK